MSDEEPYSSTIVDDHEDVQLKADYECLNGAREVISHYLGRRVLEIKVDNPFLQDFVSSAIFCTTTCDELSTCAEAGSAADFEESEEPILCMGDVCDYAGFVKGLKTGGCRSSSYQSSFTTVVAGEAPLALEDGDSTLLLYDAISSSTPQLLLIPLFIA